MSVICCWSPEAAFPSPVEEAEIELNQGQRLLGTQKCLGQALLGPMYWEHGLERGAGMGFKGG